MYFNKYFTNKYFPNHFFSQNVVIGTDSSPISNRNNLVLTVSTYESIERAITAARDVWVGVGQHYHIAANTIVSTKDKTVVKSLLNSFYVAYKTLNHYDDTLPSVVRSIGSLQKHILDNALDHDGNIFTDINDWLNPQNGRMDDNDTHIMVSSLFASLSDDAGYPIYSVNIIPAVYGDSLYDFGIFG